MSLEEARIFVFMVEDTEGNTQLIATKTTLQELKANKVSHYMEMSNHRSHTVEYIEDYFKTYALSNSEG